MVRKPYLRCKPRKVATPLGAWPGSAHIKPQPRGVVLVMGSWNFPLSTISPFIAGIAAGNAVIIKPSEFAPATSRVMKRLFEKYLDRRYYRCIEGALQTSIKLTNTAFDLICFTGSTFTGKIIAKAASAHLTPLILELGGKCPTVVDRTANIQLAARRY
jgi:aldehyde dehydrogenase (NAD+)